MVANFAIEWSVSIERPHRGRQRPGCDLADEGAHGPAHGSPCAARARGVRIAKNRPPTSDRGLRSPCADNSAHEPVVGTPSSSIFQGGDEDGEIEGDQLLKHTVRSMRGYRATARRATTQSPARLQRCENALPPTTSCWRQIITIWMKATAVQPRFALERLRDAVAGGQVDRLYVHAPGRLARLYVRLGTEG